MEWYEIPPFFVNNQVVKMCELFNDLTRLTTNQLVLKCLFECFFATATASECNFYRLQSFEAED